MIAFRRIKVSASFESTKLFYTKSPAIKITGLSNLKPVS
jgi:hypothetical protein